MWEVLEAKEQWQEKIDSLSYEELLKEVRFNYKKYRASYRHETRFAYLWHVCESKKYNSADAPKSDLERKEISDRVGWPKR